jgi:hypothetical protein
MLVPDIMTFLINAFFPESQQITKTINATENKIISCENKLYLWIDTIHCLLRDGKRTYKEKLDDLLNSRCNSRQQCNVSLNNHCQSNIFEIKYYCKAGEMLLIYFKYYCKAGEMLLIYFKYYCKVGEMLLIYFKYYCKAGEMLLIYFKYYGKVGEILLIYFKYYCKAGVM